MMKLRHEEDAQFVELTKFRFSVLFGTAVFIFLISVNTPLLGYAPYSTYAVGIGKQLVRTQTAFEPWNKFVLQQGKYTDVHYSTGRYYLADVENARITVIDAKTGQLVGHIGEGELMGPEGVFVDEFGSIYVADSWARAVYKFSQNGELLMKIERPDSPVYGRGNDFVPLKVAVDKRGNIYVVCQGVTNGLAVFNKDGRFLSFFGANKPKVTLRMILQRLLFTEAQKRQLLKIRPPSPTNVAVDDMGLVWTVTQGLTEDAIKRFNVAGVNVYPSLEFYRDDLVDISVDAFGNVYALSATGNIFVYDNFGNLLFLFGGQRFYESRLGLFRTPVALAVLENNLIAVLDKEDSSITVLKPTDFGKLVLEAVKLYNQGLYLQGERLWREIQSTNSMFMLAYKVLGNIEFKKGNYAKAFEYFRIAQDPRGYSEAFWYVRNERLQKGVGVVFALLVFLAGADLIRTVLVRQGVIRKREKRRRKLSVLEVQLLNVLRFLKNPFDAVYEMKRRNAISIWMGIFLYVLLYVVNVTSRLVGSPLFFGFDAKRVNFFGLFFDTYRTLFLFVLANYLVSEISEGEGRFRDIFIGTIASFLPYLIFTVPLSLLTNVLTLNEAFVFDFGMKVIWAWSLILLFIVIAQIHNLSFGDTIKNLLLTLFAMFLLALLIIIVTVVAQEEINFFVSIIEELMFRVK